MLARLSFPMPRVLACVLLAVAAGPSLLTGWLVWGGYPGRFLTHGGTVLQDYVVLWASGRMVLAGEVHRLATFAGFNGGIAELLGAGVPRTYWLYPPHVLLLAAPLSLLPPVPSLVAWSALTGGALWAAMRLAGLGRGWRLAVLASPAALENLFDGQNGALTAAGLLGALSLGRSRPVLAGLCLAVLTVKPQVGLVAPVCLAAAGCWRAVRWGVAFAGAWVAASVLWLGWGPWVDYVTLILPQAKALHLDAVGARFGALYLQDLVVTPFGALRAAGVGAGAAEAVQAGLGVLLLGVVWAWWRRGAGVAGVGFALAIVPLVTPYAMTYDMIPATVGCLVLLSVAGREGWPVPLVAVAWCWPGIACWMGLAGMPGLGAFAFAGVAGALGWVGWRRVGVARGAEAWHASA